MLTHKTCLHAKHATTTTKNPKQKLPITRKRSTTFSTVGNSSITTYLLSEPSYTIREQPIMSCNHSHHKIHLVSYTPEVMNFMWLWWLLMASEALSEGLNNFFLGEHAPRPPRAYVCYIHSHYSPCYPLPPLLQSLDPPLCNIT